MPSCQLQCYRNIHISMNVNAAPCYRSGVTAEADQRQMSRAFEPIFLIPCCYCELLAHATLRLIATELFTETTIYGTPVQGRAMQVSCKTVHVGGDTTTPHCEVNCCSPTLNAMLTAAAAGGSLGNTNMEEAFQDLWSLSDFCSRLADSMPER